MNQKPKLWYWTIKDMEQLGEKSFMTLDMITFLNIESKNTHNQRTNR